MRAAQMPARRCDGLSRHHPQGRTGWDRRHDRPRSLCLPDAAHVRRTDQLENGRPLAGPYVEVRVRSDNIGQAEPVPGEHALGWTFHYVIGISYGLLLVAIWGAGWLRQPGIAEPLILALALLILPYFVMMPGMGMGMAGSRTPKPNVTRLKSVIGHSMFGIGMYLTARLMEAVGWLRQGVARRTSRSQTEGRFGAPAARTRRAREP